MKTFRDHFNEDHYLPTREIALHKFENLFRKYEHIKTYQGFVKTLEFSVVEDIIQQYLEDKEWVEKIKINYQNDIKLVENKVNHILDKHKSLSELFKTHSKYEISEKKEGFPFYYKTKYVELIWTSDEEKNQFLTDFANLLLLIKEINDEKYKHKYFASEIILSPYGKFTHNERIDSYLWKDNFGKFVALCTQIYLGIFPDDFRSENKKIEFWKGIDSFSFFQLRIPHLDIDSDIAFVKETIVEFENKILPFLESRVRKIERIKHAATNNSYVYVLSNKSHPSIYKIGSTNGTPKDRAAELSSTGVLHPFKVSFQIEIKNAEYYEKSIHKLLKDYRVKQSREFFKFDLSKIKDCLEQVSEISEKGEKKLTLSDLKERIKI